MDSLNSLQQRHDKTSIKGLKPTCELTNPGVGELIWKRMKNLSDLLQQKMYETHSDWRVNTRIDLIFLVRKETTS